ncbi:MAG: hypothetical protein ACTHU0_32975 [Kofleriaceae bacterium]
MSSYVAGFRWSSDPEVPGDADALIDYLWDLGRTPARDAPRALGGPGDPVLLETAVDGLRHPAIEPFDADRWIAALLAEIDGRDLGPQRAVEASLYRDERGAALVAVLIVADDRAHELRTRIGRAFVAAGMSAYDHDTGATLEPCRPKRWLVAGGARALWDPSWPRIAASLEQALRDDELRTLESASGALVQFLGSRDRLAIEHLAPGETRPSIAGRGEPTGATEIVRARGLAMELDRAELLEGADAIEIFRYFFDEQAPHPAYRWRRRPPER